MPLMNNIQYKLIHPWFRGFKGSIQKVSSISYITKGVYRIINNVTIEITELPIGTWTNNYKNFLDGLIYDKLKHTKPDQFYIKDYIDNSDDIKGYSFVYIKDQSMIDPIIQDFQDYRMSHNILLFEKIKLSPTDIPKEIFFFLIYCDNINYQRID